MHVLNAQRLTFALVGQTNAGKSTLLNLIAGQDVSIASPIAGTTTDLVQKAMELPPIGPILLLDTGGWHDQTTLGQAREAKTAQAIAQADILLGVIPATTTDPDSPAVRDWLSLVKTTQKPAIAILTHCDETLPTQTLLDALQPLGTVLQVAATDPANRDAFLTQLKTAISAIMPPAFINPPTILADLIKPGDLVLQVTPIDSQAPKGRLIVPQVVTLRDALDQNTISIVVKVDQIAATLAALNRKPDLVVCDSQVVQETLAAIPEDVPCTTYSVLMARIKGDLQQLIAGVQAVHALKDGDKVLIAEACTHHATQEDIGRVKIPNWLQASTQKKIKIDIVSGKDFPANLADYALIVHCGGCMINRPLMLWRIKQAQEAHVPITNYGVCISAIKGVLPRVITPFIHH